MSAEESKTCESCGGSFTRPYKRGLKQWARARYCSQTCSGAGHRRAAEAPPPPRPKRKQQGHLLSSSERTKYGCIVTAVDLETGRVDTLCRTGQVFAALRDIVAILDAREGDWRVRCISTPETVYRDLNGGRAAGRPAPLVESRYLAELGRQDLMEPRTRTVTYEWP